jgi:hypothetical protein
MPRLRHLEAKTVAQLSEAIRTTHTQDGGVVLDIRHGRIFALNIVGSKILEFVKKDYEAPQIAQEISQEFGISPEVATADVREFLESLEKHALIERRDVRVES